MFGYIICNKSGLSKEELERYQSVYCGLCRALGDRFGQKERMSLSFDMAFLALLLSSLYEPEEKGESFRCPVHPLRPQSAVKNEYIDYAADLTILLTYFKCLDDWQDEQKKSSKKFADILKKSCDDIERKYPRQWEAVSSSIQALNAVEKASDSEPDQAINCSGRMLSELFVYKEDFWSNSLRLFGFELGRFIYLMDAAIDYKKDLKTGNYNPLLGLQKKPEDIEPELSNLIGSAAREFEKLPLVQDLHLLRNILYGGVWQQYYAKVPGKEKQS